MLCSLVEQHLPNAMQQQQLVPGIAQGHSQAHPLPPSLHSQVGQNIATSDANVFLTSLSNALKKGHRTGYVIL